MIRLSTIIEHSIEISSKRRTLTQEWSLKDNRRKRLMHSLAEDVFRLMMKLGTLCWHRLRILTCTLLNFNSWAITIILGRIVFWFSEKVLFYLPKYKKLRVLPNFQIIKEQIKAFLTYLKKRRRFSSRLDFFKIFFCSFYYLHFTSRVT